MWLVRLHKKLYADNEEQNSSNMYTRNQIVYIYQMGKVGSISLWKTLENQGEMIRHQHNLTLSHSDSIGVKRILGLWGQLGSRFSELKRKIYPCQRLRTFRKTSGIKIISLIREPISRNLSLCFQHSTDFIRDDVTNRSFNANRTLNELFSYYLEDRIDQSAGIRWFDREFLPTTGVNIYDYPFDKEEGYAVIQTERYDILVLQCEMLKNNLLRIQEFLGLSKPFELAQLNVGDNKWYRLLYKEFKKNYRPSKELVDTLYSSQFMKHFYSKTDIKKFKQKWIQGS